MRLHWVAVEQWYAVRLAASKLPNLRQQINQKLWEVVESLIINEVLLLLWLAFTIIPSNFWARQNAVPFNLGIGNHISIGRLELTKIP